MRQRMFRMFHRALIIVVYLVYFLSFALAQAEPASESHVESMFECNFISGAELNVKASMIVNSINVFDTTYNRQTIEDMAATNPYIMGAIMLRLHEAVKVQVESAFPYTNVDTINTIPMYEKPFFIDMFRVNLTPAFFGYNGSLNLTNFIEGILDMGATITYYFDLFAQQGWNTTFVYTLPSNVNLVYANTAKTNLNTNIVQWVIRNWDGTDKGTKATLSIQSKNPTTPTTGNDDITLEYILDTRKVTNINFTDSIIVKKINIRQYNMIPTFVTGLESLPADGLRLFINNGLLTWEDFFAKTIQPIEQQTTHIIENSSFQQNLNLSFSWDSETTLNCSMPYNVTHMDDMPAIKANFQDIDVDLRICQIPARALFGLLNSGANVSIFAEDINFGFGLNEIMYPYEIMLCLPTNITLNGEMTYLWNNTTPISGTFHSGLQPNPPYTTERVETYINIDLIKMDLNIPSLFSGKTDLTASLKMKEDDNLYIIRCTDELPLSQKINISYLNADALRLCIEEKVFSNDQINMFLSKKNTLFQQRLSEVFHGLEVNGVTDRNVLSNSLVWDGDISSMSDVVPVVVSNSANEVYLIRFNVSLWPAELAIVPQQFMLKGIENQTVTYRISFPRGIEINTNENIGKPLIIGKTNDGRDYVELTFNNVTDIESTILTCVLNASPVYVLGLFLPCVLVFLLLVVLIIIIYLIRKKRGGLRRGKHKLFEPEDNEPSEYSDQEYYVPPPPSSIKKKK